MCARRSRPSSRREPKDMRLGALRGGEFVPEDPFRTRAQAASAAANSLHRLRKPAIRAKFYQWLAQAAGQFGSQWSTVVLVGAAPDVDAPLRDYATAYVASRFQAQKVRLSYWNPGWAESRVVWRGLPGHGRHAAGGRIDRACHDRRAPMISGLAGNRLAAADGGARFLLYRARLTPAAGPAAGFPAVAARAGRGAAGSGCLRRLAGRTSRPRGRLAARANLPRNRPARFAAALAQALRIEPVGSGCSAPGSRFLRALQRLCDRRAIAGDLGGNQPKDGALLAELGHAHFVAQQLPQAEAVLLRARENGADGARVPEELARIHLSRGDDAGAMPFLDESLKKDAKQPPLWFLRADAAGV